MRVAIVIGLVLGLASLGPLGARAYHMEDSLRGGTIGNPVGGSIGGSGWTVTDRTDRIWWEIPRLASGSIEFTIANVTLSNLVAADNELFAMYEAGYGISEPIRYSPEFRNNHYKAMIRVYGTDEPGRTGQQKLMWGMCPSGAPGYDACGCGSFFAEPFGGDPTWDGSPQRFRVEWGGGVTRLLRNGAEVVRIDWSASGLVFGPDTVHFSIGTARPSAVGGAAMPVGAVISDVVVDGVEGPRATCSGPVEVDAGPLPVADAGPPPVDAGSPPTDAGPSPLDAGPPPSADAGGLQVDASPAPSGGSAGLEGDGCGCHVPGSPLKEPALALVVAVAALGAMRRRRR
jgi:MYXO-CTERM domain-containing protein